MVDQKKSIWTNVTPFSKYFALVLFVILPFLGGYIGYTYAPEKIVEVEKIVVRKNANPADIQKGRVPAPEFSRDEVGTNPVSSSTADLDTFIDTEVGLTFKYPSEWGVVTYEDENKKCNDKESSNCNLRLYFFKKLSTNLRNGLFLATETNGDSPDRGSFWGDKADSISSNYLDLCIQNTTCSMYRNENDIIFAKYRHQDFGWNESYFEPNNEYLLFDPRGHYFGFVFSPIRIKEVGDIDTEELFENTVINTFNFVE